MTLRIPPPAGKALFAAFAPATPQAIAAWRKAVLSHRDAAAKDVDDLPKFVALWAERHLDEEVAVADLARMAIKAGLFPHLLRRTVFSVRCTRLGEFLARVVLVQGHDGIVPGLRFVRTDPETRTRRWVMRKTAEADAQLAKMRWEEAKAEAREDEERRKGRKAAEVPAEEMTGGRVLKLNSGSRGAR